MTEENGVRISGRTLKLFSSVVAIVVFLGGGVWWLATAHAAVESNQVAIQELKTQQKGIMTVLGKMQINQSAICQATDAKCK